jgi:hypothetical protein
MKKPRIEITELFMAKADWDRCFHGTIKRDYDENDNPIVYGKIKINGGYIYSSAPEQKELGRRMDDIVKMILDFDLHKPQGITTNICETKFFHN